MVVSSSSSSFWFTNPPVPMSISSYPAKFACQIPDSSAITVTPVPGGVASKAATKSSAPAAAVPEMMSVSALISVTASAITTSVFVVVPSETLTCCPARISNKPDRSNSAYPHSSANRESITLSSILSSTVEPGLKS